MEKFDASNNYLKWLCRGNYVEINSLVKKIIKNVQKKSPLRKTRSQWQIKRLRVELPPQRQHYTKVSCHRSCESGLRFSKDYVTSHWLNYQKSLWL